MSDQLQQGLSRYRFFQVLTSSDDGHFAVDTIRNVFWFCVIGLAALGLQNFVAWTESSGGSAALVFLLTLVEYAVLIADVVWFLSRLIVGTYKVLLRAYRDVIEARSSPAARSTAHS